MRRLDSYILTQMIGAFSFFTLIFTGVIWLTQSIRLIDTVISSGQSAAVFLEFSVLLLPRVLSMVFPLSAFAAAIYTLNKLYSEAELVVMMTSGQSPFSLARPVLMFGLLIFALTLVTHIVLVPFGTGRLEDRRLDIRTELANAFIREGVFLHPARGVTLYIRDTSNAGEMAGIFLHDERSSDQPVTYSAERALLLRKEDEARLVMSRGIALTENLEDGTLSQVRFDEFTYDLREFIKSDAVRIRKPAEYPLLRLLSPDQEMLDAGRYSLGDFVAEGHEKITNGLTSLLLPLIALAVIMTGGYQRRGFTKRIVAAIGVGVMLVVLGIAAGSAVSSQPAIWPVAYLPGGLAVALVLLMLGRASGGRRRRAGVPA